MITFFTLGTYISSGMKNILTNYYFCQPMTEYLYSLDSRYLWFISDCVFHNQFCYPPSFQPQSSAPQLARWILEAGESHCYSHTFPEFYYHLHGMMQFHAYTVAFYTPCFCTVVELVGVLQCAIDWTTVQKVIKRHCTVVYVYYPLTVENFVKYCVYCIWPLK